MNTITDIKEYLRREREKRQAEGMSVEDFSLELGIKRDAARRFINKEVAEGRLKANGTRAYTQTDGSTRNKPVYILVPHEA